jgi:lysophospholipase L1-like esterase
MTPRSIRLCSLFALLLLVGPVAGPAAAQPAYTTWFLAEGDTTFFDEEILIANPNASPAQVTVTFLPQDGSAIAPLTFTMPPTSRRTVDVRARAPGKTLSAIVESTNGQPIVVERSMYWWDGLRRGGHNVSGVTAPATDWFLAEGATNFFDTYILLANPDAVRTATLDVRMLRERDAPVTLAALTLPPGSRATLRAGRDGIYLSDLNNNDTRIADFSITSFSTVVESRASGQASAVPIIVERAMYFAGPIPFWEGGHASAGVTNESLVWEFAEGYTGLGVGGVRFDTFLLLANRNPQPATAKVTFFLEGGGTLERRYRVAPNGRETVWVNLIQEDVTRPLANTSFGMTVESVQTTTNESGALLPSPIPAQAIVAERSVYWGPDHPDPFARPLRWVEGHNTVGITAPATGWAFAEGVQDGIDATGTLFTSYFLLSNASTQPLTVKATFMREAQPGDPSGVGAVRTFTVPARSRFTISARSADGSIDPALALLSNQRFSVVLESESGQPFVAERAVYWGQAWHGGHAAGGTPWTATVGTPLAPPAPTIATVTPSSGPMAGGTLVTITGTEFTQGAAVMFGGTPAPAASVTVLNATTLRVVTPVRVTDGPTDVTVTVSLPDGRTGSRPGVFRYFPAPTITSVTPASGPSYGGTQVTLIGTRFFDVTPISVTVGGRPATNVQRLSDTTIRFVTPPRNPALSNPTAPVAISVAAHGGSATAAGVFTYTRALATDNILAFGDSITWGTTWFVGTPVGFPPITPVFPGRIEEPYPAKLQRLLRTAYPAQASQIVVEESGVPGECTWFPCGNVNTAGRNRITTAMRDVHDLVIIFEGVNDLNSGFSYFNIQEALRSMVRSTFARGKLPVLCTLLPVSDAHGDLHVRIIELNRRLRLVAQEEGVVLADLYQAYVRDAFWPNYLSVDGLHPNDAGYEKIAQTLHDVIRQNFETVAQPVP